MAMRLIVHGGAWSIPDDQDKSHLKGIENSLAVGFAVLEDEGSAIDAVEASIRVLEEDPTFDAGKGSFLNDKGNIEMDAIIVDGRVNNFGAVAGISRFSHPVSIARKVLEDSEHCFLVGHGAEDFALSQGFTPVETISLLTEREQAYYLKIKGSKEFRTHHPFEHPSDTVGAVAMDATGSMAVATSTGGTPRKMSGRVGDSPIYGAGAYLDNSLGACSTTGWGEAIMRALLAKDVVDRLQHESLDQVVIASLERLNKEFQGYGGVIGITYESQYFLGHNTSKMAYGYVDDKGGYQVGIML